MGPILFKSIKKISNSFYKNHTHKKLKRKSNNGRKNTLTNVMKLSHQTKMKHILRTKSICLSKAMIWSQNKDKRQIKMNLTK